MQIIWGGKGAFKSDNEKSLSLAIKIWRNALADLTDRQIEQAYNTATRLLKFPPAPVELRELAFGIKSPCEAFALAEKRENMSFRNLLCSWDWQNLPEKELRQKFYGSYSAYRDKVLENNYSNYR